MTEGRRVLLLQGPPSGFFGVLRRAFAEAGVRATRVNLHAGDSLRDGPGVPFTGRLEDFAAFLEDLMTRERTTDVLYFADRLPYHRIAAKVAGRLGAIPYAVENGYLRPDWLTLEPGGMGAFSRFPDDPQAIRAIAEDAPRIDDHVLYRHSFTHEAWCDVSHTLARLAGTPRYRHFERDRDNHPLREYLSWSPQLIRKELAKRRGPGRLRRVIAEKRPFFLFPLQLQEDYQIRHNSRYERLADLVDEVFASFARAAPEDALLLIKIHPLDNGLQNWRKTMKAAKHQTGLTGRIRLLGGGPLLDMVEGAEGVVLVNSTVGIAALRTGRPLKTLGSAIYDVPGLVDRQPLDDFWNNPQAPDPELADAFVRALARATQLKGSFYDPEGMRKGAEEIVRRVKARIGEADWFTNPPPRLKRAEILGVDPEPPVGRGRIALPGVR